MSYHPLIHFILLFFICSYSFAANLPKGIEHIRTLDDIEEYRLTSNGLRILLLPNEGLPVATVMVTYEVGSRNETTGTTGATHILEHMMFKGTDRFNRDNENDYSRQMERIGARSNATTWFDRTNYFATLPSQHVLTAIELEADRMRNLRIKEEDLRSEMTVVRNEYDRGENSPVRTLIKELFAAAFFAHPYGDPTIGWESDIENVNVEKLQKFYDTYYWPENTVVTIIGGFDRKETLAGIVEHYGKIPNSPRAIPLVETVEPEQIGPRRVTIERNGQVGVVMIGFRVPEGVHEDWPALRLIDQILGADKTGRLYRALEDKGKASGTFTFGPQLRDPGLFLFGAYLTEEATHEGAETIIHKEIQSLINGGIDEDELARAKSVIRAQTVYGRDGSYSIAGEINECIAMGDWTQFVTLPKAVQEVTAADVQRVAATYFQERRSTTGWFVPTKGETAVPIASAAFGPNYYREPETEGTLENIDPSMDAVVDFSSKMQRKTVAGIEVIAIDMPVKDMVSFKGGFAAGESLSPADQPSLASLTASMLDKGTINKDRFQIAEQLDTLGGASISFEATKHALTFGGRFLRTDAGPVISLLAEQLRSPAFKPEVFETLKTRQNAALLRSVDDPGYRAESSVMRLLYPEGHPNHVIPIESLQADLEAITIENLRNFHAEHYGPKSMTLVFAGDIDFDQLTAAVESAFADWEGGVDYPAETRKPLPQEPKSESIFIDDKTSVSVLYGQTTGLRRTDENYLPFMVGNYILGGSFESRLMQNVRKKAGLTYSIYSAHTGDLRTTGHWILGASFAPELVKQGTETTEAVLLEWHENGPSEKEVASAIETLTGSYQVGLSTTGRVANQVFSYVMRGLDATYIDEYPVKLTTVTSDQVTRAIQTYLDPSKLVFAQAGTLANSATITPPANTRTVSVRIDTPNSGWEVAIKAVYKTDKNLVVVSQLDHSGGMAAQVITTVYDSLVLEEAGELPVKHYVIGKTWNWGSSEKYTFVEDAEALEKAMSRAEVLFKDS
ncbi:MAG: pitrilysin family protein [Verrucomicrobiota bacterium]